MFGFVRLFNLLHCDIPCGIYDPHSAQLAAHTVYRMNVLMAEAAKEKDDVKREHAIARHVKVKEEHADLCKREVRIIWGDFFKAENHKDLPGLHDLVFKIMKQASKARQSLDLKESEELINLVNKFAELFWKAKGKNVVTVKAPYPTEKDIVILKPDNGKK